MSGLVSRLFSLSIGVVFFQTSTFAQLTSRNLEPEVHSHLSVKINAPLKECDYSSSQYRGSILEKYLEEILNHIINSNLDIFRGYYSPENICLIITDKTSAAAVPPQTGMILFSPLFLLKLKNDAEVAAVLSHELGHIINYRGYHPVNKPRELSRDINYSKMLASINSSLQGKLEDEYKAVSELINSLDESKLKDESRIYRNNLGHSITTIYAFDSDITKSYQEKKIPNEHVFLEDLFESITDESLLPLIDQIQRVQNINKYPQLRKEISKLKTMERRLISEEDFRVSAEVEADIAGYGLFLKSGFSPNFFYQRDIREYSNYQDTPYENIQECLSDIERGKIPKKHIYKESSYTGPCWRIYNTKVVQNAYYQEHAPYLLSGNITEIPSIYSLEDAKNFINKRR